MMDEDEEDDYYMDTQIRFEERVEKRFVQIGKRDASVFGLNMP
jgi:hypothetical protein